MAVSAKDKKQKESKHMNTSKSEHQGAFTKKSWNESTTAEKVKGVAATAAAAAVAGGTLYHAFKK